MVLQITDVKTDDGVAESSAACTEVKGDAVMCCLLGLSITSVSCSA